MVFTHGTFLKVLHVRRDHDASFSGESGGEAVGVMETIASLDASSKLCEWAVCIDDNDREFIKQAIRFVGVGIATSPKQFRRKLRPN